MHIPILLDTDIGDDIDDALALNVALNSPELTLMGITTVFRDAPKRAILAREVLKLLQRDGIPVVAGCSQPLLPDWEHFPNGKALGRQFEALDSALTWDSPDHAVPFIVQSVRDHASRGETLTLVPIGALTNIAIAFHLAPDIVSKCRVVLMGGKWSDDCAEWNILCDPEAAAMVFRSGVELRMVGLDVTLQCVLSGDQEQMFLESCREHVRFLGHLIQLWGHPVTLHDPLTILSLFTDLVQFEPRCLEVGLHGEKLRARTIPTLGEPNCLAAVTVEADRAKALFLERVGLR